MGPVAVQLFSREGTHSFSPCSFLTLTNTSSRLQFSTTRVQFQLEPKVRVILLVGEEGQEHEDRLHLQLPHRPAAWLTSRCIPHSQAWREGLRVRGGQDLQRGRDQGGGQVLGESLYRRQGEDEAEEERGGGFCLGRAGHWPREGLSLVRNDFLRRGLGGRPLQMVVSHEVLKVKVHRCQRPLHSSGPGSKIQTIVIYDDFFLTNISIYFPRQK